MSSDQVEGWNFFQLNRTEFELSTVLACGQSFRWKKKSVDSQPDEWTGVFAHHAWSLRQNNDGILYKVHEKTPEISEEESTALLKNYFQLDIPLGKLYKEWSESDSRFAKLPLQNAQGIRILKQDPIETIFAFICSANNNIGRISQMVEKLCMFYGETICDCEGKTYYDFPRVEKLQGTEVEAKLRAEGFGYRAGYIAKSANLIVSKGGKTWIEGLEAMGYQQACKELQTLVGVGRKVADCVCLMGLGFHQAIPVDTHIYQLGKEYLPELKSTKTVTDRIYTEISNHFRKIHGEYCGWAQSVLFTSRLKPFSASSSSKKTDSCNGKRKRKRGS